MAQAFTAMSGRPCRYRQRAGARLAGPFVHTLADGSHQSALVKPHRLIRSHPLIDPQAPRRGFASAQALPGPFTREVV